MTLHDPTTMWRRTSRITKHFPDRWTESGRLRSACLTKVPSRFLQWQILLLTCYFVASTHAQAMDFPAVYAPHSQVNLVRVHAKGSAKLSHGNSVHKVLNIPYTLPPGEGIQAPVLTSYRKKTLLLSPKLMSSNTSPNRFQPTWLKGSKMSSRLSKRELEQVALDNVLSTIKPVTYNWHFAVNDMILRMLGAGHDIPQKARTQSSEDASAEKPKLSLGSFRSFGAFKRYPMSDNKVAMVRSLALDSLYTPEINVNVTSSHVANAADYTSTQAVTTLSSTETQTLSHTGVDVTMKTEINSLSSATHYPLTNIPVTDEPSMPILNSSSISYDLTSFTQKQHLAESSTDGWHPVTLPSGPSKNSHYHTNYVENESNIPVTDDPSIQILSSSSISYDLTSLAQKGHLGEGNTDVSRRATWSSATPYPLTNIPVNDDPSIQILSSPSISYDLTSFTQKQHLAESSTDGWHRVALSSSPSKDSRYHTNYVENESTETSSKANDLESPTSTAIPDTEMSTSSLYYENQNTTGSIPVEIGEVTFSTESLVSFTKNELSEFSDPQSTFLPTFSQHFTEQNVEGLDLQKYGLSAAVSKTSGFTQSPQTNIPDVSITPVTSPIHSFGAQPKTISVTQQTEGSLTTVTGTVGPTESGFTSHSSPYGDGTMEFSMKTDAVMTSPSEHTSEGNLSSTLSPRMHVSESASLTDSTEDSSVSSYILNVSAAFTTEQMSTSLDQVDLQTPSTEDYFWIPILQDDPTFTRSPTSAPSPTNTELKHITHSSTSSSPIFSPSSSPVPNAKEQVATTHSSVTSLHSEQTAYHSTDRNVTPIHVTSQTHGSGISVTQKWESPMNATTSPEFTFNSTMEEVSLSWLNGTIFGNISIDFRRPKHSCPKVTSTASVTEAQGTSHIKSETSVVSTQKPHTRSTSRPTTLQHSTVNDTKDHLPSPHIQGPITMRGEIAGQRVNDTTAAIDVTTLTSIDVPTTTPSDTGRFFDSFPNPDDELTLPTSTPPPVVSAPLKFRILGILYSAQLQDKLSEEYAKLGKEVTLVLNKIFSTKYSGKFLHANINKFLNGSVIAHADLVFNDAPSPSGSQIVRTLLSSNLVHENDFGWRIDTSSVESKGFTSQTLEPKSLSIYFLVLHVGFMAENYTGVRLYLDALNQGVMRSVGLSLARTFSISKIRDLNGDLEVRGNLSLDTNVDLDMQAVLRMLLPLANLSVDLSSVVVDGHRMALEIYKVTFRITNKLFQVALLDMSSFRFKELSINLSAVVKLALQEHDPSQVIIREFRSGSIICRGIIVYKLPAPGSGEVLRTLMGSLGPGGTLGSSPYIIDVSSLRVGDSTPGTDFEYVHFPGFAVAIIVMCGLSILIFPFVVYVCIKTKIFGHRQKASFTRRNNPDRHSHQFEMDNRAFRASIEEP